ncbi:MAG: DNA methyltransferase [Candidatus Heimdallarchaeota archaeon]
MPNSVFNYLKKYLDSAESSYQTIILDLRKNFKKIDASTLPAIWNSLFTKLAPSGSLWVFVQDYYDPYIGSYIPKTFEILEQIAERAFHVKNCIVRFKPGPSTNGCFSQFYDNILFCTLDSQDFFFDKDKIREPHIWKDAEWGGGRRSRYNPKGKDPSNVWITTESERGKITAYKSMSDFDTYKRILMATCAVSDPALLIVEKSENSKLNTLIEAAQLDMIYAPIPSKLSNQDSILKTPKESSQSSNSLNSEPNKEHTDIRVFYKSSESMEEVPAESIQSVITSPPYWGLRDYDHPKQIGYDESYEKYRTRLISVWKECSRVLSRSGTMWVNVNKRIVKGSYLNIPHDCYKDITSVGFAFIDLIVWHRPISVPGYGEKNLADRYETILLFAKDPRNFFLDKSALQSDDYSPSFQGELLNIWKMHRKIGNIGKTVRKMVKECGLKHTAMFPEELPRRAILLGTKKGERVLDPFLGSGTTLAVAKELGRRAISYEINSQYEPIIQFRLKSKQTPLEAFLQH